MLGFAKLLCCFNLDFAAKAAGAGQQSVQVSPTDLLKPFCIYLQFMFIVATMQGITWPATLSKPFQALLWLFSSSSPQSLSLECILPSSSTLPVPVQIFILSMVTPLSIMALLLVLETVIAYLRVCACLVAKQAPTPSRATAYTVEKQRLVS
jgi:hypothetical protein